VYRINIKKHGTTMILYKIDNEKKLVYSNCPIF